MAITMLPYLGVPSSLNQERPSGRIRIPAGAYAVSFTAVVPEALQRSPAYVASLAFALSDAGQVWEWRGPSRGPGGPNQVPAAAVGMAPGQIPADMTLNFDFAPGDAIAIGREGDPSLGGRLVTCSVTPLGGNPDGGIEIAVVAEAWDREGNPLSWDTATRAARGGA